MLQHWLNAYTYMQSKRCSVFSCVQASDLAEDWYSGPGLEAEVDEGPADAPGGPPAPLGGPFGGPPPPGAGSAGLVA